MSALSMRPYVPFCRVRMVSQSVSSEGHMALIAVEADERSRPICYVRGTPAPLKGYAQRTGAAELAALFGS